LAQTQPRNIQAMNNTNPNLTIIYDNETTKKETDFMMTNTTPNPLPILNWHN